MMRGLLHSTMRLADHAHGTGALLPRPAASLMRSAVRSIHSRYLHSTYRRAASAQGLIDIESFALQNVVPMQLPLVLISQVERSGGSLLSQLFDGHPEVAVYPDELRFGLHGRDGFPEPSARSFIDFADLRMHRIARNGYRKGRHGPRQRFVFSLNLQRQLFERKPCGGDLRQQMDLLFESFFNAWLDYRGDLSRAKMIVAFAPRLALSSEAMDRFFKAYPDGHLIQIERDFESWDRSAKAQDKALKVNRSDADRAAHWSANAASIKRNRQRFGDRVTALSFDELRGDTEAAMRNVAGRLNLAFDTSLLQPTFNGNLMWANSSFAVDRAGLLESSSCSSRQP